MSAGGTDSKHQAFMVAISASASLAVMIVDFIWQMPVEVRCIWPKMRKFSWQPLLYMFARYLGMASQIFSVYFAIRMYRGIRTSPTGCSIWFAYQAIIVQFFLIHVEALLMHRIYALYLKNPMILSILVAIAVGQASSMIVSARFSLPNVGHTDTCIILKSPPGNAYFGATTMLTCMIIFFLNLWKYFRLRGGRRRQEFVRVAIRDSLISVSAISVVMLFLTLSSFQLIRVSISGNLTYYWLVSILWWAIGRIIINHERLPREFDERDLGEDVWRTTLQLTSRIELGEFTQDHMNSRGSNPSSSNTPASDGVSGQGSSRTSISTNDMIRPGIYRLQLTGSSKLSSAGDPESEPSSAV